MPVEEKTKRAPDSLILLAAVFCTYAVARAKAYFILAVIFWLESFFCFGSEEFVYLRTQSSKPTVRHCQASLR